MRTRLIGMLAACFIVLLAAPSAVAASAAVPGDTARDTTSAHVQAADNGGESIKGTLRGPGGKPLPKVSLTVESDGSKIGTDKSGKDGTWEVPVPEPGRYKVSITVSTLPKNVQVRTEGGEVLKDVQVRQGQARTVIFPMIPKNAKQEKAGSKAESSEPEPTASPEDSGGAENRAQDKSRPFIGRFIQQVVNGLKYGAIIAITAVGLSLVFGTTRLINFAHGELVTIGAMVAYFFSTSTFNFPLVAAAVLALVIGGLVGAGMEVSLWRPMRRRGTGLIQLFIISIGLSLLLRHLLLAMFGSRRHQYDQYTVQQSMDFGPISITPRDLTITLISAAVLIGVAFMLMRTRIGKATRAVADNKDLAEASGIDVNRVILIVWILGGALAGLGGVMYGLTTAVYWNMGFNLLLLMFAGVILGGLGSAFGAVVGSLVVGLVAQLSTLWFPVDLQNAWALLTLIVVLIVRPQGILGRAERAG